MNPTAQLFWVQKVRTLGTVTPLPPTPSVGGDFFLGSVKIWFSLCGMWLLMYLQKVTGVSEEPLGHLPLARILTISEEPATPYSAYLKIEAAS